MLTFLLSYVREIKRLNKLTYCFSFNSSYKYIKTGRYLICLINENSIDYSSWGIEQQ